MIKNDTLQQSVSQAHAHHSASVAGQPAGSPLGLVKRGIQRVLNRLGYQLLRFPAPHSYEWHILGLLRDWP